VINIHYQFYLKLKDSQLIFKLEKNIDVNDIDGFADLARNLLGGIDSCQFAKQLFWMNALRLFLCVPNFLVAGRKFWCYHGVAVFCVFGGDTEGGNGNVLTQALSGCVWVNRCLCQIGPAADDAARANLSMGK
jgi:hypothetical protein